MSIIDEIRKEPITEVVSKEALEQIDLLISKLEKATELQKQLNKEVERYNYLYGIAIAKSSELPDFNGEIKWPQ